MKITNLNQFSVEVPPVSAMMDGDIPEIFKLKFLIYLTELELTEDLLRSVNTENTILLVALTYLIAKKWLHLSEAFMILHVLNDEDMGKIAEDIQYPEYIDERGFKVSHLLLSFCRHFQFCLNSIGFKKEKVSKFKS